jgi:O-antigen/teichoic acid export membrane protein
MWILKAQMMRENELGIVGKALVTGVVILLAFGSAIRLGRGEVSHPGSLWIVALGLVLFLIAKFSVIFRGNWISFGSRPMTEGMGNTYRFGYWLMIVGILIMVG